MVVKMKKVFAFLADGLEEVEALMVIDLLRRTHKIDVTMVSITGNEIVTGSHNIKIIADEVISNIDFEEGDMIFLPGGMPGTLNLGECAVLTDNIVEYNKKGKKLAAICAAPSVLGQLGVLSGKNATCYPGFEDKLTGAIYKGESVATDANVTTANGLGSALELGLELIRVLVDEESSEQVAKAIQYK